MAGKKDEKVKTEGAEPAQPAATPQEPAWDVETQGPRYEYDGHGTVDRATGQRVRKDKETGKFVPLGSDGDGRNLAWVGKGEPPTSYSPAIGPVETLPDAATQRAGFRSRYDAELIGLYPGEYKAFREDKGAK